MGFQITWNGNDISNNVISFTRSHSLCSGAATCSVTVNGLDSYTTWDTILIYEDGNKKGTFYISDIIETEEKNTVLNCQDGSKRLEDYFVPDTYISEGVTTARYWIEKFLDEAGVSYNFRTSENGALLNDQSNFGHDSVSGIIVPLLQQSGWYIIFDENDTAQIGKLDIDTKAGGTYFDESNILSASLNKNDSKLRNKVVVWGGMDRVTENWITSSAQITTPWNIDSNDIRTITVSSNNIRTYASANNIAIKLLQQFADIERVKTVELEGFHNVKVGDLVYISSRVYTGTGMITSLELSATSSGITTTLILDEKCPRLFGYFSYDGYVYVGTWGGGVYRKPLQSDTFSPYNTGLGNYYIKDLFINNGLLVCVTKDGYAYTSTTATASWNKLSHGSFTDLYDNEYSESSIKASACTIDEDNSIIITYNHKDSKQCWLVLYNTTTGETKKRQIITEDNKTIKKATDLDNNGYSSYIIGYKTVPESRKYCYHKTDSNDASIAVPTAPHTVNTRRDVFNNMEIKNHLPLQGDDGSSTLSLVSGGNANYISDYMNHSVGNRIIESDGTAGSIKNLPTSTVPGGNYAIRLNINNFNLNSGFNNTSYTVGSFHPGSDFIPYDAFLFEKEDDVFVSVYIYKSTLSTYFSEDEYTIIRAEFDLNKSEYSLQYTTLEGILPESGYYPNAGPSGYDCIIYDYTADQFTETPIMITIDVWDGIDVSYTELDGLSDRGGHRHYFSNIDIVNGIPKVICIEQNWDSVEVGPFDYDFELYINSYLYSGSEIVDEDSYYYGTLESSPTQFEIDLNHATRLTSTQYTKIFSVQWETTGTTARYIMADGTTDAFGNLTEIIYNTDTSNPSHIGYYLNTPLVFRNFDIDEICYEIDGTDLNILHPQTLSVEDTINLEEDIIDVSYLGGTVDSVGNIDQHLYLLIYNDSESKYEVRAYQVDGTLVSKYLFFPEHGIAKQILVTSNILYVTTLYNGNYDNEVYVLETNKTHGTIVEKVIKDDYNNFNSVFTPPRESRVDNSQINPTCIYTLPVGVSGYAKSSLYTSFTGFSGGSVNRIRHDMKVPINDLRVYMFQDEILASGGYRVSVVGHDKLKYTNPYLTNEFKTLFSGSAFSGENLNHLETTNYGTNPYFFVSTSGHPSKFFQKDENEESFNNHSLGLPSNNITIIRTDDRI
jgi:hypothetical protein